MPDARDEDQPRPPRRRAWPRRLAPAIALAAVAAVVAIATADPGDDSDRRPPVVASASSSDGLLRVLVTDMRERGEALPHGAETYDWASRGRVKLGNRPGARRALIGWGQVYACSHGNPDPSARVELRDIQTWVLSARARAWRRVQTSRGVDGAAYREDFRGNANRPADARTLPDGGTSVTAGRGYNFHFWPEGGRVRIDPSDIAGIVVAVRARLLPTTLRQAARPCYVASVGADFWADVQGAGSGATAVGDAAIGRLKRVDARWRAFTMTTLSPRDLARAGAPPLRLPAAELR